jgi:hypothetical protein
MNQCHEIFNEVTAELGDEEVKEDNKEKEDVK